MQILSAKNVAATLALTAAAGLAHAGTVKGNYDSAHSKTVNITSPVNSGDVRTVTFNWTRADLSPISPGADLTIPANFITYCIELNQNISSSGGDKTFTVLTPAAHGFTSSQTSLLLNLWSAYQPTVSSSDESAAFQSAVWEIVYDTDLNLQTGSFKLNTSGAVRTTAQNWLNAISSPTFASSGPSLSLAVLKSSTLQDQLTVIPGPVVPAPASAAIGLLGGAVLIGRRKRPSSR